MCLQMLSVAIVFLTFISEVDASDDVAAKTKETPSVKKNATIDSTFVAGSKWKGIVKVLQGQEELTTDLLVTVTKREGSKFQGTYEGFSGARCYLIEGTIERNQVNFKIVKIERMPKGSSNPVNLVGLQYKGTLRMDTKTMKPTITSFYTWESAKDASIVNKGTVIIALVEEENKAETASK